MLYLFDLQISLAKPFVKWAGGKGQLIKVIDQYLPKELKYGLIKNYVEPFVGGGALLFHILQNYKVENAYIFDVNKDLINAYRVIKNSVDNLIEELGKLERKYLSLSEYEQEKMYYEIREKYNSYSKLDTKKASYFIFLNKTCYNGLFRVNKNGKFNVPFGKYKNPKICDEDNLLAVNKLLDKVEIYCGDYTLSYDFIDESTFVYFDPPYLPISSTSNFTSYTETAFGIEEQIKLSKFFRKVNDEKHAFLMLSNSDPTQIDPENRFFEKIYSGFNVYHVYANRFINSKSDKRGRIREIIVVNYNPNLKEMNSRD